MMDAIIAFGSSSSEALFGLHNVSQSPKQRVDGAVHTGAIQCRDIESSQTDIAEPCQVASERLFWTTL